MRNDKQHYQDGFFIYDISTFNERVVREAILNAVSHRMYQMSGSIFIRQYRDRLVVESPGGFPNGITLDNILNRQSPRNRRIAEILSLCGLVERSGQGMNLIYEISIMEAKELPDFTGTDNNFVSLTLNGLIIDKKMLSVIKKIGEDRLESFSTSDFLIVNALYHENPISEYLRPRLKWLADIGVVDHVGRNRYVLSRQLYAAVGKTGVHTRIVGLDRDTNKELILTHIQKNRGTRFNELQQVLPSLSRGEVQVLMRELKELGYTSEPHAAVAYRALRDQLNPGEYGLFLGTAHPAKFKESVEAILGETLDLPKELAERADLPLLSHNLPADFAALRKLMMNHQ